MLRFLRWLGVPDDWLCWLGLHGEHVAEIQGIDYWQCDECDKRWGTSYPRLRLLLQDKKWIDGEIDEPREYKLKPPRGGSSTPCRKAV